jgi:hypothetical protein
VGGAADLAKRNPGAPNGRGAYTDLLCAVKSVTKRCAWMHGALLSFFYCIIYSFLFSKYRSIVFIYLFINVFLCNILFSIIFFNKIFFSLNIYSSSIPSAYFIFPLFLEKYYFFFSIFIYSSSSISMEFFSLYSFFFNC